MELETAFQPVFNSQIMGRTVKSALIASDRESEQAKMTYFCREPVILIDILWLGASNSRPGLT